ncbi:CDP-diacylglycerol--glycerol-3-phosphate 3-phosphatidyltransferase [Haloferula rosea]|uniref:CDP-diacylglycerol--glycerol-3-phosphate 3-phosphatidyltransferase n=1 Tax=Haloferula rosea TaxID=490093 RepID=A0A934RCY7_9BACT|nr:CDP-diacylglycerol--glycerol-3-phosphate 3-phosphatidyltransferase [Haloferula rosea]MBK1828892.1 CDP-diacylglycerol--glycerol-3-phosphate 3-phosphatidyltransferase [Haloferula rosea]
MNLPNAITLSRLVLAAVFVVAMGFPGLPGYLVALVSFSVAAATDWLDGYLARKMGLVTPLGKLLDPLADKILVCAAFVFMSVLDFAPVWVTALIIGREFLVTGLRQIAVEAGQVLAADRLGKWKTTFQLIFIIAGLVQLCCLALDEAGPFLQFMTGLTARDGLVIQPSLWISLALTVISGGNYVWSGRHLLVGK